MMAPDVECLIFLSLFCSKVIDLPLKAFYFHFKIRCLPFEKADAVKKDILLLAGLLSVTFLVHEKALS